MKKLAVIMTLLIGQAFAGENEFLKLCQEVENLPVDEQSTVRSIMRIGSNNSWGEPQSCEEIVKNLKAMDKLDIPGRTFHYYYVDSLKPIVTLDWIKSLSISGQDSVKDITPLAKMELSSLDISDTGVRDLNQLTELPHLLSLTISIKSSNDLGNISQLKNLRKLSFEATGMSSIDLSHFEKSDLTSLTVLASGKMKYLNLFTKLESLRVNGAGVDVRELVALPLKNFTVGTSEDYPITHIDHLAYITTLEKLNLSGLQLRDVSFLQGLTRLKGLDLSDNNISNVEALNALIRLEDLDLSRNEIMFDDLWNKLVNLKKLDLSGNRFSFFNATKMAQLETLDLSNNNLHEVTFEVHSKLGEIKLGSNQIRSPYMKTLTPENLPALKVLDLSGNKITTLERVGALTTLENLSLDDNKITSVHELQDLVNLKYLSLRSNLIKKKDQICPVESSTKKVCDFLHQEIFDKHQVQR